MLPGLASSCLLEVRDPPRSIGNLANGVRHVEAWLESLPHLQLAPLAREWRCEEPGRQGERKDMINVTERGSCTREFISQSLTW